MLFPGNTGFGLPSSASGSGGFNPMMQAPWRTIPWAPEAMPTGTPIPVPSAQFGIPAESYLPAGVSADIPGFDPLAPGGGLYPEQVPAAQVPMGVPSFGLTPSIGQAEYAPAGYEGGSATTPATWTAGRGSPYGSGLSPSRIHTPFGSLGFSVPNYSPV